MLQGGSGGSGYDDRGQMYITDTAWRNNVTVKYPMVAIAMVAMVVEMTMEEGGR
jgi:hypothetical protein